MPLTEKQLQRQARARRNWSPPGPIPPGAQGDPSLAPGPDETLDAFAGHWRLFQLRHGHRYSTDDLLAAWYAVTNCRDRGLTPKNTLDLGCGIGSVGLFVAWSFPKTRLTGIEAQEVSARLARRSIRYNGLADRAEVREGDLRTGVPEGAFDLVTGSPPYWDPEAGTLSDAPQKAPCRFEQRGGVEDYCMAAASALAPQGLFALVMDGRQRERVVAGAREAGLAILSIRDVIPRAGKDTLMVLAAMTHAGTATEAPREEPPLILRERDGARTDEFRAIRLQMGMPPG
jgi:tRNA1(Val) A37 N6-methylase TrmN6